MRDTTIFYRSFYEAIKELPAQNQLEVYNAIFELSLNGNEVELSGLSKTIFTLMKPNIEANIQRFKNGNKAKTKQKGSENEAKTKQDLSEVKANKDKDKDVNKDNDKDVEKKESKKKKQFEPPTIEQVKEYFVTEGYKPEIAEKFFKYYETGEWKDSKGKPIRSWKQKAQAVWFKPENSIGSQTITAEQEAKRGLRYFTGHDYQNTL